MRIETEGRSDVPHFARRLCLLVRQTCGKIARAMPGTLFLHLSPPLSFRHARRFPETHNSIAPISKTVRRDTPDEERKKIYKYIQMRITIFPGRTKGRRFPPRRHVSMLPRWSDASYNMRMTHRKPAGADIVKATVSCSFVNGGTATQLNIQERERLPRFANLFSLSFVRSSSISD